MPSRLPRERDQPREPRAPRESKPPQTKGLSRGMKLVLGLTGFVGLLSIVLVECGNRGKAGRAAVHWNAPPTSAARTAPLEDLRKEAIQRATKVVPGARLSRISARRIDGTGSVDLEFGGATFDFVAPPGASLPAGTPCGLEMAETWQGWTTRPHDACPDAEVDPRCTFSAAYAKAFPTAPGPGPVELVLEGGATPSWTFWTIDPPGKAIEIADDCAPPQSM